MKDVTLLTIGGSFLVVFLWMLRRFLSPRVRRKYNLPPGPRPLPLLGNALDMPTSKEPLIFTEWSHKYGPICHAKVLSKHVVVLSSYEAIYEALIRQSKFTSNRPRNVMVDEIMGWCTSCFTTLLDYGDTLREHRAITYEYMQPLAVKKYHEIQTETTYKMLGHMLDSPEKFMHHIRRGASASIMSIVYGHHVISGNDKYITLADVAMKWFTIAGLPARYWVDSFPWLKHVPDWFPGTGWKDDGRAGHEARCRMFDEPFLQAKMKASQDALAPCIVSDIFADALNAFGKEKSHDFEERVAIPLASALYAGGSDTTVGLIECTVLALVLDPSVLIKAQREIDRVIGSDRLPTIEDRESLPYIEGMVREALRWHPVLPLGVAHATETDIAINDFEIPAGTWIIPNIWGISHDEKLYPEPFKFSPERWLDAEGNLLDMVRAPLHPNKLAFGFGRRICPGRHLAENHLFIVIACLVAVFDFEKCKDDKGRALEPRVEFRSGLLSDPLPFECVITPRSSKHSDMVHQAIDMLDLNRS